MTYVQVIIIIKKVFQDSKDYPIWLIFEGKQKKTLSIAADNEERNNSVKHHLLILP